MWDEPQRMHLGGRRGGKVRTSRATGSCTAAFLTNDAELGSPRRVGADWVEPTCTFRNLCETLQKPGKIGPIIRSTHYKNRILKCSLFLHNYFLLKFGVVFTDAINCLDDVALAPTPPFRPVFTCQRAHSADLKKQDSDFYNTQTACKPSRLPFSY